MALFCFVLLLLTACEKKPEQVTLTGDTMGTTYHVTLVDWPETVKRDRVHIAIERILVQIDHDMSNYSDSSVLSQFNRLPPGQWFEVPPDLYAVVKVAQDISAASGGAYDITVSPLVDVWGFGPRHTAQEAGVIWHPPSPSEIEEARSQVGSQYIELQVSPPAFRKQRWLTLDLSSIAPGYAVDRIAFMLDQMGINRYLVEVGGELRVKGLNGDGQFWKLGIEDPRGVVSGQVRQAVSLQDKAMATSGNYRQFFEWEGVRYSHSVDPRSGMAVAHDLVSVTVLADTAAEADAWATAFAVLGTDMTLKLSSEKGLPVYLQVQRGDKLDVMTNPAMKSILEATQ